MSHEPTVERKLAGIERGSLPLSMTARESSRPESSGASALRKRHSIGFLLVNISGLAECELRLNRPEPFSNPGLAQISARYGFIPAAGRKKPPRPLTPRRLAWVMTSPLPLANMRPSRIKGADC
jgi:hypothetical protein